MKNVKDDREIEADNLKRSEKYRWGAESAEKEIKRKITELLNKYKSKLQEETQEKISKRINHNKINEILNKLNVLKELEDKL